MGMTIEARKRSGAYYTSETVAAFLATASIRTPGDRVLEPCCGEGVFLSACERRLRALAGGLEGSRPPIVGVELDGLAAQACRERLPRTHLIEADFFSVEPGALGRFDVVIGNPPFIRYHRFRGSERDRGLRRAQEAGVELSRLTSSWVPFLIHATQHLAPGGRLAVVAPLELTYARYARRFVSFLSRRFAVVRVLLFDEPLFPELNEAAVLLIAEGWGDGPCAGMTLDHLRTVAELDPAAPSVPRGVGTVASEWRLGGASPRLLRLPEDVRALYRFLAVQVPRLGDLADLTIGYVTGANRWFHLARDEVVSLGLEREVRLVVRRAGDLTGCGLSVTSADSVRLGKDGAHWLFAPAEPLAAEAAAHVERAMTAGVARAYKCRVRDPWWRVPGVQGHSFLVGVLSTGSPRLVATKLPATNSLLVGDLHGVEDTRVLAAASVTSLAALSAEVVGHALGGGALKFEPAEARRWVLPVACTASHDDLSRIDDLLRRGHREDASAAADEVFLRRGLRLTVAEVRQLRDGAATLRRLRQRIGDVR